MSTKNKIPFTEKLVSTSNRKGRNRTEDYWRTQILDNVFGKKRSSKEKKNDKFQYHNQQWIINTFKLRSIEYGNWLAQDDRYIYLAGFAFAAKDFCEIHSIPFAKFGKAKLGMAFGSRGRSASLAHYEPQNDVINITRHRSKNILGRSIKKSNPLRFDSSGAGSLGHEYGHFLDFHCGRNDKNIPFNFASETIQIIDKRRNKEEYFVNGKIPQNKRTKLVYDIMFSLMYQQKGDTLILSNWYRNLEEKIEINKGIGKYWILPVEIFARSFEVYLYMKCQEKKITESFLKKKKYDNYLYPSVNFLKTSGAYRLFYQFVKAAQKL